MAAHDDGEPASDPLDPKGSTGENGPPDDSRAADAADGIRGLVDSTGSTLGNGLATFFGQLLSPVPFSSKIWGGMANRGLYNYYRTSGADAIGLEAGPNGRIKLTPIRWKGPEQCSEEERPGWHAKGSGNSWKPTTLGQQTFRVGKTPVVPLDTESWRATNILEARVAEAVDQGETRPLYRVDEAELEATIDTTPATGGAGAAVADGGQGMQIAGRQFNPRHSPIFEDMIVDLGSEDYDGQAVSWRKTSELLHETTTQEEMANQHKRGELMGRSRDDMLGFAKRIFLYAALVALGGLIGPEIVSAVLGGGGGGGGIVPISMGVW